MQEPEKVCTKCGQRKLLSAYYRHPTGRLGRRPDCKECHNAPSEQSRTRGRRYRERHRDELNARDRERRLQARLAAGKLPIGARITVTEKRCKTCGQVKPAGDFSASPRSTDGLRGRCKACTVVWVTEHNRKHPEVRAAWRERNRERIRQQKLEWRARRKQPSE